MVFFEILEVINLKWLKFSMLKIKDLKLEKIQQFFYWNSILFH